MQVIALITNIKSISGYDLELSLMNSKIHNWEQKPLEEIENEGRIFYRLGLQCIEAKFKLKNSSVLDKFVALDNQVRTYNVLETLISELGISEFATLKYKEDKMIFQSNLNFDYTKLRDMQNMDWAEESIRYGEELKAQGKTPEEVLQYYESAIDLDALNATAYVLKGDVLVQMGKVEEAVEAYKMAYKLDSGNETIAKKYEDTLNLLMKGKASKPRHVVIEEGQSKLLLKNGRPDNENYKMMFE